ncbi:LppU/SCO3897 family protein [Pseudonocardia sp. TRM90224]|uniref:LppU/SCO3897 family protein n=1 Tax=Pseudonocardia sp. TRM90224 TaxID=2812678 RepID=UPI001E543DCD|nr:hypothetical protein [Pseudonocardia sp. TRM90224]
MSVDGPPSSQQGFWARYRKRLISALPIIVIGAGFVIYRFVATANGISGAEVGACAAIVGTGSSASYEVRDCGDPQATLTVLAQLPRAGDCRTVAGAEQSTVDGRYAKLTCFGPKGVDPATSLNTAAAGECLTETGAERRPCSDPAAAYTILKRVDAVAEDAVDRSCDGVEGATGLFPMGWTESSEVAGVEVSNGKTDYTVLCVGAKS